MPILERWTNQVNRPRWAYRAIKSVGDDLNGAPKSDAKQSIYPPIGRRMGVAESIKLHPPQSD